MDGEEPIPRQLTTPRSAAIAGIIFSLLLGLILTLLRISITPDPGRGGRWITDPARHAWVVLAVNLVPFAGIAFLWFLISVATIAMRTRVMPRWLAIFGYASAAVLLVNVNGTPWVQLLFPLWVLLLSAQILRRSLAAVPRV